MMTIYSNGKKQRWLKKDGNKLSKRKSILIKNSKWYKLSIIKQPSYVTISIGNNPTKEILDFLGNSLELELNNLKIIKDIIKNGDYLPLAHKLYILRLYSGCNKVADIVDYIYELDNSDINKLYEEGIKNMNSIVVTYFNNAIEFDFNSFLKYNKGVSCVKELHKYNVNLFKE